MNKRFFGYFEVIFDVLYLCAALSIGILILISANEIVQVLAGSMAIVLALGDAFHLIPRIVATVMDKEHELMKALGLGKLITSISMTAFYAMLWHIGILLFFPSGLPVWTAFVYALATLRVIICLFKQNKWSAKAPPVIWGIYRNIPFLLMGIAVAVLFGKYSQALPSFRWMWLAITLSFAFYIPVVLWSNRIPRLGMLMLPKTCAYLWILVMCLSL